MPDSLSPEKRRLVDWFSDLQRRLCLEFETLESESGDANLRPGKFQYKPWQRHEPTREDGDGGGGTMALLQGRVFEKAGVNISIVSGKFAPEFSKKIPGAEKDPSFWAAGISVVVHPMNPFVPAVHFNTRYIETTRSWFGGGTDLTPTFEFPEDTRDFHQALQDTCDQHDSTYYPKFKLNCDEYFYLPHRKEARGVGGVFYDNHNSGVVNNDIQFTKDIGETFLSIYSDLVRRHADRPWTSDDKQQQLIKRGRYVEFNLLYDRGTQFGLQTGANPEAVLMSMPPVASWS